MVYLAGVSGNLNRQKSTIKLKTPVLVNEVLFYTGLIIWLVASVLYQTSLEEVISEEIQSVKGLGLFTCFVSEIISKNRYQRSDLVQIIALFLVAVGSFCVHNTALFQSFLLIYFARNFKIERVLTCFAWTIGLSLVLVYLFSFTGLISSLDLVESSIRQARSSMGFVWPSRFPTFFLAVVMAYVCVKRNNTSNIVLILMFLVNIYIYTETNSRNPFLATALFIVIIFIKKYISISKKRKRTYKKTYLIKLIIPALLLLSVLAPYIYDSASSFWTEVDRLLANRLLFSNLALSNSFFSLWGDGRLLNQENVNPFIDGVLDSGYLTLLFGYGIIACLIVLTGFACAFVLSYVKRDFYLFFALLITLLFSLLYSHMIIYLCYSPIMFYIPYFIRETIKDITCPTNKKRKSKKVPTMQTGRG